MLYAWGNTEPSSGTTITKHTQKGSKMVNLMEQTDHPDLPPDAVNYTFRVNHVSILKPELSLPPSMFSIQHRELGPNS